MPTTVERPVVRSQIEPRLVERRRGVLEARRRKRRWRLIGAACGAAALACVLASLWSPVTDVDRIEVTGTQRLDHDSVRAAAGVAVGDQLIALDLGAVRDRLRDEPLIAGATVVREWPGSVHIDVVEEVPVLRVRTSEDIRVVSRSGRVLPADMDDGRVLPELEIPEVRLVEGASLPDSIRSTISVFTQMPQPLRDILGHGRVDDVGDLSFRLADDATVHFGPVEDVPAKLAAAQAFLSQVVQQCLDVVDVRQPDLVTASRRSGCAVPAPTEADTRSGPTPATTQQSESGR